MTHYEEAVARVKGYSAYALAKLADVAAPDSQKSMGARLLGEARDNLVGRLDEIVGQAEGDRREAAREHAVGDAESTILANHDAWLVFVDLALWLNSTPGAGEDIDPSDVTESLARFRAYEAVEQMAYALWGEIQDAIHRDEEEALDEA